MDIISTLSAYSAPSYYEVEMNADSQSRARGVYEAGAESGVLRDEHTAQSSKMQCVVA